MNMLRGSGAVLFISTAVLAGCGSAGEGAGTTTEAAEAMWVRADAGASGDAEATTGKVTIEVVGDAVSGNAGAIPPDTLVSTPIAGVSVYDGTWQKGTLLGKTDAKGQLAVDLPLGKHEIGVKMKTGADSSFSSSGNAVKVTKKGEKLVIHVAPSTVDIETPYDAGQGNAIYVTGETTELGSWETAYKATYDTTTSSWDFKANLQVGAQYKLILAPWVSGSSIEVSSAGVQWQDGNNETVPSGAYSVVTLNPTF